MYGYSLPAGEIKLDRWFSLSPDFSNLARVYWISDKVIAVAGSDTSETSRIRLINIETKKVTDIWADKNGDNFGVLSIIAAEPEIGIFIYCEELEIAYRDWRSTYYLYDLQTGVKINLNESKSNVLAEPYRYFYNFRYYLQEGYPREGSKVFYELLQVDNYKMKSERLIYVHPKEWLKAEYNKMPLFRDYDKYKSLILFKYNNGDTEGFGDYYIGSFDGVIVSEMERVNYSDVGDARILDENHIIAIGGPMNGEFYSLLIVSIDGTVSNRIKDMLILNNRDNLAVNHHTGKIAVVRLNEKLTDHGVFVYSE